MSTAAKTILSHLEAVASERTRRVQAQDLGAKVVALKAYQQQRFSRTYADLLASRRYAAAARFFLDELYGPSDFSRRDAQFARVVPALVRLFPTEIVETVAALAELHALSESLDTAMAVWLAGTEVNGVAYVRAWQGTGRPADRASQVTLTVDVAARLDRFTRRPLLRSSLRLMRGPARAAGLGELQHFLETGFDTFREMNGAGDFMRTVETRERAMASALFGARLDDPADPTVALALENLP